MRKLYVPLAALLLAALMLTACGTPTYDLAWNPKVGDTVKFQVADTVEVKQADIEQDGKVEPAPTWSQNQSLKYNATLTVQELRGDEVFLLYNVQGLTLDRQPAGQPPQTHNMPDFELKVWVNKATGYVVNTENFLFPEDKMMPSDTMRHLVFATLAWLPATGKASNWENAVLVRNLPRMPITLGEFTVKSASAKEATVAGLKGVSVALSGKGSLDNERKVETGGTVKRTGDTTWSGTQLIEQATGWTLEKSLTGSTKLTEEITSTMGKKSYFRGSFTHNTSIKRVP